MTKSQNVKIYIKQKAQYISYFNKLTKVRESKTSFIDGKMFEPEFMQFKRQRQ